MVVPESSCSPGPGSAAIRDVTIAGQSRSSFTSRGARDLAHSTGLLPLALFDGLRPGLAKDRSQFYRDFAAPFFGANRPGAQISQGVMDQLWLWSMQIGTI